MVAISIAPSTGSGFCGASAGSPYLTWNHPSLFKKILGDNVKRNSEIQNSKYICREN